MRAGHAALIYWRAPIWGPTWNAVSGRTVPHKGMHAGFAWGVQCQLGLEPRVYVSIPDPIQRTCVGKCIRKIGGVRIGLRMNDVVAT